VGLAKAQLYFSRHGSCEKPNGYANRQPCGSRAVQRAKRAGLSMLLGRLARPNTRSTERAIREVYRLRPPERGAFVDRGLAV
jgi:hypothetical protein